MSTQKINSTTDYRMFKIDRHNRPLDMARHKRLVDSMGKYGFIPAFPIVCVRDKRGGLRVRDGQHRLHCAESLGLAVYWTEEATDFNIADINSSARGWRPSDYAMTHAANGKSDYQEVLDLSSSHGIPITIAAALLAGRVNFSMIASDFYAGQFVVGDRLWASSVANLYSRFVGITKEVRNAHFLRACMAVCRVHGLELERLISGATKRRDFLGSFGNRDSYLEMLEKVYNFNRSKLFPLKVAALTAMRDRNPATDPRRKSSDTDTAGAA